MLKRRIGAIAITVGLTSACGWRDVSFTLVFRDAGGLRPGHLLVLQGVPVGQVESVDLSGGEARVEARLYRKYRETVCSESSFMVEKPGGILDLSGEKQVSIARRLAGACTPVSAHAIIRGDDSLLGSIVESASQLAAATWAKVRDLAQAAAAEFEKTRGGKPLADEIRSFGKEGTRAAAAELEALRRRAETLKEELGKDGRAQEAEALWRQFEMWYRETLRTIETRADPARSDPS